MTDALVPVTAGRLLTAAAFQTLAQVPPELERFANLGSKATRRAYEHALAGSDANFPRDRTSS